MDKKLTVIKTAELLGVSKEAIYNRIRRGSLKTVLENGVKYVILTDNVKKSSQARKQNSIANDAYIQLLREGLRELKEKNKSLEEDKDRLIHEKERLLIESKEKLEEIYKQRDEQLKTILTLATQVALENKNIKSSESVIVNETESMQKDTIDVDVDDSEDSSQDMQIKSYSDWQDLRDYLKQKGYSKKQKKTAKEEFSKNTEYRMFSKKRKEK